MKQGTIEHRLNKLSEFTEREFKHDPFSSCGFETTLFKGVKDLQQKLNKTIIGLKFVAKGGLTEHHGDSICTARDILEKMGVKWKDESNQ